ncbi:MAG: HEAT repeat domain-containing protein, partial [Elusimicrobia bacterium]|nr:HEAT repeat domain-containing protein [Elusimicrobiota bacterium]
NVSAKNQMLGLGRWDKILAREILLEISERLSGVQGIRAMDLYEFLGFAEKEIHTLKYSWFWWSRAAAAHYLGQMRVKKAKESLIQALEDKNVEVRLEATWAIGHMRFVDVLPHVVENMAHFFKIAALRMDAFIFEMGAPALPVLLDLCRHPEHDVQLLAIHLVGEFKDFSSVKTLLPLLNSSHLEIRMAACKAVGSIGESSGLSVLIPYLKDSAWQMRAQTAKQFARNRFTPAVDSLIQCLEDKIWWVRYNSGEALFQMRSEGKKALRKALGSQDRFARDMATQWLDELEAGA